MADREVALLGLLPSALSLRWSHTMWNASKFQDIKCVYILQMWKDDRSCNLYIHITACLVYIAESCILCIIFSRRLRRGTIILQEFHALFSCVCVVHSALGLGNTCRFFRQNQNKMREKFYTLSLKLSHIIFVK